jgi:integrase/recombinase XerC
MHHIANFIEHLQYQKRASKHTITAYQKDLEQFAQFLKVQFEVDTLIEANHKQIRAWILLLSDEKKTPKTIQRKLATLRSFYKFLLSQELIPKDPTLKVLNIKTGKRLPTVVLVQQMQQLFEKADFSQDYKGQRDRLILELLYGIGLRRAELTQLTISDLDFGRKAIIIHGKGNKQRLIPCVSFLQTMMEKFIALREKTFPNTNHPQLFLTGKGEPVYEKLVYRVVHQYLSQVTTIEQRSPHVLRHTFATHLLDSGAELNAIKELLGHSSLAATQIYTHNSIEKLLAVYQKAHPKAQNE